MAIKESEIVGGREGKREMAIALYYVTGSEMRAMVMSTLGRNSNDVVNLC